MSRRIVVDPTAVLSWFESIGPGVEMRRDYESGGFTALAPRRLHEDVLAAVAEREDMRADRLVRVAAELPQLGVILQDAPLPLVAGWLARGLDARTAPYAALAESLDLPLVSFEPRLLRTAAGLMSR